MTQIFTIGHSTRPALELIEILQAHGIRVLCDVRTIPRSRTNPQFNQKRLAAMLQRRGIRYLHLPALGGLRRPRKDSSNAAWRNASFRGYADYMQTEEFEKGLERLLRLAAHRKVAIMCAEGNPWRCHRHLVADAVIARGGKAFELSSPTRATPHRLTPFARIHRGRVTYPATAAETVVKRAA